MILWIFTALWQSYEHSLHSKWWFCEYLLHWKWQFCKIKITVLWGVAPCSWWVVNLMPQLLYSWGRAPVPKVKWAPEHVWMFWGRKYVLSLPELEPPDHPAHCLVAILSMLSWLHSSLYFHVSNGLSQWKSCSINMVRQTTIQWTRTSPSSLWVYSV
jgi:hypothetical protein